LGHLSWEGYWKKAFEHHKAELKKQGLSEFKGSFCLSFDPPFEKLADKRYVLENIFRPDHYEIRPIEELSNPAECKTSMTISINVNKPMTKIYLNSTISSPNRTIKGETDYPSGIHPLWHTALNFLYLIWLAVFYFILKDIFSKKRKYKDHIRFIAFWHNLSILRYHIHGYGEIQKEDLKNNLKNNNVDLDNFLEEVDYFSQNETRDFGAVLEEKKHFKSFLMELKKDFDILRNSMTITKEKRSQIDKNLKTLVSGISIELLKFIDTNKVLKKHLPSGNPSGNTHYMPFFLTNGVYSLENISQKTVFFFSLLEAFIQNTIKLKPNYLIDSEEKKSFKIKLKLITDHKEKEQTKNLFEKIEKNITKNIDKYNKEKADLGVFLSATPIISVFTETITLKFEDSRFTETDQKELAKRVKIIFCDDDFNGKYKGRAKTFFSEVQKDIFENLNPLIEKHKINSNITHVLLDVNGIKPDNKELNEDDFKRVKKLYPKAKIYIVSSDKPEFVDKDWFQNDRNASFFNDSDECYLEINAKTVN
jgi:hypothetical protein